MLQDPNNIKREQGQFVEEFQGIQNKYNVLMLQEELKSMLVENQLLKELNESN